MTQEQRPLWLSIGENCLPDDILKRHSLKSFSTPYSSGRSNIDYALALEARNYANLLDKEHLIVGDAWGKPVVRSSLITQAEDIFDEGCSKGFEFTHHNPIESAKDRDSYVRKIERLQGVRGKQPLVFLYHHRRSAKSNIEKLTGKLRQFAAHYTGDGVTCTIALFHQTLVSDASKRRLETRTLGSNLVEFVLHTEFTWGGNNPDIFWARNDEDLIQEMLATLKALQART